MTPISVQTRRQQQDSELYNVYSINHTTNEDLINGVHSSDMTNVGSPCNNIINTSQYGRNRMNDNNVNDDQESDTTFRRTNRTKSTNNNGKVSNTSSTNNSLKTGQQEEYTVKEQRQSNPIRQYPQHQVNNLQQRMLIGYDEVLVPVSDPSDPSYVASRKSKKYGKRKKQQRYYDVPTIAANDSVSNNPNYQTSSVDANIDNTSYLLEGITNKPPNERYYSESGTNMQYLLDKEDTKSKKQSWASRISILISIVTVFLCGMSLLAFFVIGSYKNRNIDSFEVNQQEQERWRLAQQYGPWLVNPNEYMNHIEEDYYDDKGWYIVEDYDVKKSFSNFLPGLAGLYGKPFYAFYVNRGQGISSFGIESKDYPIQEFHTANIAYQNTPFTGFRTFLQGIRTPLHKKDGFHGFTRRNDDKNKVKQFLIEPFSATTSRFLATEVEEDEEVSPANVFHDSYATEEWRDNIKLPKRHMYIGSNEMKIQEIDSLHSVETNVTYFTLPEEDFGAFVRRVVITNTDVDTVLTISAIDGLAQIQPAGGKLNDFLKNMGNTLEGWKRVYQVYNDTFQMPFYKLSTQPSDDAAVVIEESGHWVLSIMEAGGSQSTPNILLPIIYDPDVIFGDDTSLLRPSKLYTNSISNILHNQKQYGSAKTPSAFAAVENIVLQPQQSLTITTYFGISDHILEVPVIARLLLQEGFGAYKMNRAQELTSQITATVATSTSNALFNGHIKQMYLDNSLQGGIPFLLGEVDDEARMRNADEDPRLKVYHLFSRIHGDLERDYNDFVIKPTFFSEGPGNFRDVIQNRRNDVLLNPRLGSFNIRTFLSFIQADGYEPLTVEAIAFTIKDKSECVRVATRAVGEADGHRAQREALTEILHAGPFRPGQVFQLMEEQNIELMISRQDFVDMVAATATYSPIAKYTNGFWADHWTYYIDLIESYLSIYPDWEQRIMFEESLPYYFSPAFVKPRSQKYILSLSFDGRTNHVRQLKSTDQADPDKTQEIRRIQNLTGWFESECNWQHDEKGEIFKSSPIAKLFLLATVKFATRDPYGMGIEYEGGRPGWDDANNGLVGMLGSGMPETYELISLVQYIQSAVQKYSHGIVIPEELYQLVVSTQGFLDELTAAYSDTEVLYPTVPVSLFRYWDNVSTAREVYREQTKVKFTGKTRTVASVHLNFILQRWLTELNLGVSRAMKFGTLGDGDDGSFGITPTYFSYNIAKWNRTGEFNEMGHPFVHAKEAVVGIFPLFLEGPTRMMKTIKNVNESLPGVAGGVKEIYNLLRKSPLRDQNLQMYTVSASLKGQSIDMGREMALAPGWLENQSVWLHMSYKLYLELLRHNMYDEFYFEMLSGGILPFMNPDRYGRSLMECSSFITSSAFDDPKSRGRGYLARLSGSTAEYLSMWVLMMIGSNPFTVNPHNGQLQFTLRPAVPRWLFRESVAIKEATNPINLHSNDFEQSTFLGPPSNTSLPTLSFKLFGAIDVTYYHNRGDDNLFGLNPSRYVVLFRDGTMFHVDGPIIAGELADKIRRVIFISSIDAYFDR